MQITRTIKPPNKSSNSQETNTNLSTANPPADDGWVGAALSVAGGVATVVGAVTNQPLLSAGGALTTALGTGLTAHRVSKTGMDSAAMVSFGVGGGLMLLGAVTHLAPETAPAGPQGPLPTLLRDLGIQTLPF